MSFIFDVNETPATNATAIFQLKTLMKSAGWTVTRSSDGTTFNASGDQITGADTGANGMNNNNAWFVLKQPAAVDGYQRQILFFRGTNVSNWWVQYSISSGFSSGGATSAPTAADAQNLFATSSSGGQLFSSTEGGIRWHVMADNSSPYSFAAFAYNTGGGNVTNMLVCDRMTAGSFPTQDNDPYVWYFGSYNNNNGSVLPRQTQSSPPVDLGSDSPMVRTDAPTGLSPTLGFPSCWFKYALSGATFTNVTAPFYANSMLSGAVHTMIPCGLGSNPHTGNDDLFPLIWARTSSNSTPVGYKGTSSMFQWCGAQRSTGDTVTVSTASDHIVLNGTLVLPWNGANPLI